MLRIAIIGSGMTGVACARRLSTHGVKAQLFDKGRGIGGRMATRRTDVGAQFDHGAQYVTAVSQDFAEVLHDAIIAGAVAPWAAVDLKSGFVGVPGMTGLIKYLGRGLEIEQKTEVTSVSRTGQGWHLLSDTDLGTFDRVVCTIPSPQAKPLMSAHLPDTDAFDTVCYAPSLTLMVALKDRLDLPDTVSSPTEAIAWMARDSSKPQRPDMECWVAQATADWSADNLERSKDEICELMLSHFLACADADASQVTYSVAHRWRFALVSNALGRPYLSNADNTLFAGGDWCLGPKVEHAWQSGVAIADAILGAR